MERTDRLHFKDMIIVNKRLWRELLCFPYDAKQAIEGEISLSNSATLSQSELIQMSLLVMTNMSVTFALLV